MFDDLLSANSHYTATFDAGDLQAPPQRKVLILTCMDARIEPLRVFGLQLGDAHVLRNAGGRVSDDVVRSLLVSSRLLGVEQVVVMQHTRCGMTTIGRRERELLFADAPEAARTLDLLEIEDHAATLAADVAALQQSPLLPPLDVAGFLYDVGSGRVQQIV